MKSNLKGNTKCINFKGMILIMLNSKVIESGRSPAMMENNPSIINRAEKEKRTAN